MKYGMVDINCLVQARFWIRVQTIIFGVNLFIEGKFFLKQPCIFTPVKFIELGSSV